MDILSSIVKQISISHVVSVFIGILAGKLFDWFRARRVQRAHWLALSTEVAICVNNAIQFIADKISAPLGRFPTLAYTTAFPALLSEGRLNSDEGLKLGLFYGKIEELNRGLDNANQLLLDGEEEKIEQLHSRNIMKAEQLINLDKDLTKILQYHRVRNSFLRFSIGIQNNYESYQSLKETVRALEEEYTERQA